MIKSQCQKTNGTSSLLVVTRIIRTSGPGGAGIVLLVLVLLVKEVVLLVLLVVVVVVVGVDVGYFSLLAVITCGLPLMFLSLPLYHSGVAS